MIFRRFFLEFSERHFSSFPANLTRRQQPRLEAESLSGKYDSQSESSARSSSLRSNFRVGRIHHHFDRVACAGEDSTICWYVFVKQSSCVVPVCCYSLYVESVSSL